MMRTAHIILFAVVTCLVGCTTQYQCPKEHSYAVAMQILCNPGASSIFDQIEECNDVVALRIIAFTASVAAWPMEEGLDVNFDNRLDDVFQVAMYKLFAIDSNESKEAIEYYKRAFPPDGAHSLLFKEWEEERSKRKEVP